MRPTWWQRRSTAEAWLTLLAAWTGWVALQWWSYLAGDLARLAVSVALVVVVVTFLVRQSRKPGGLGRGLVLRRALREGVVPRDADTSWWPAALRAGIRQHSSRWFAFTCIYSLALGGILVTVPVWADQPARLGIAAAIGATLGAIVALVAVPAQRRGLARSATLLAELER